MPNTEEQPTYTALEVFFTEASKTHPVLSALHQIVREKRNEAPTGVSVLGKDGRVFYPAVPSANAVEASEALLLYGKQRRWEPHQIEGLQGWRILDDPGVPISWKDDGGPFDDPIPTGAGKSWCFDLDCDRGVPNISKGALERLLAMTDTLPIRRVTRCAYWANGSHNATARNENEEFSARAIVKEWIQNRIAGIETSMPA